MKKFKIAISLIIFACVLCLFSGAAASTASVGTGTGKAIINHYGVGNTGTDWFFVTNITDNPINVIITFYEDDGTFLTDDGSSTSGLITESKKGVSNTSKLLNYSDKNSNSSLTFTLNAHVTGLINISDNSKLENGYDVIQWTQKSSAIQGLTAECISLCTDGSKIERYPLSSNNGSPF